jgi:hypothetical protein
MKTILPARSTTLILTLSKPNRSGIPQVSFTPSPLGVKVLSTSISVNLRETKVRLKQLRYRIACPVGAAHLNGEIFFTCYLFGRIPFQLIPFKDKETVVRTAIRKLINMDIISRIHGFKVPIGMFGFLF